MNPQQSSDTKPTVSQTPSSPQSPIPDKKKMKLIAIAGAAVVVVILIIVGISLSHHNKNGDVKKAFGNSSKQSNDTKPASSLSGMKLTLADDIISKNGLKPQKTTNNQDALAYATPDNSCLMTFGTTTPQVLPGDDISSIASVYLDSLRKAGAQVDTPTSASPLVLSGSDSKMYSFPTVKFQFTFQGGNAEGYYSAAVLKGEAKTRALISSFCKNEQGPVDQSKLNQLNDVVKKVVVNPR